MMIFKNNAFENVSTEDAQLLTGQVEIGEDSSITFADVAMNMIATEDAIAKLNELSLNIATESTILFANALEGQKVSETPGISTEAVEGFGIEADDSATEQSKKAQGKKSVEYLKKAGEAIGKIINAIVDFFKNLWRAITNIFKVEDKAWTSIIEASKGKTEKAGKLTVPRTVNPEYWTLLTEAYDLTFVIYEEYVAGWEKLYGAKAVAQQVATGAVIGVDMTTKFVDKLSKLEGSDESLALVSKKESDVESVLRVMGNIKFPKVTVSQGPSIFKKIGAKMTKKPAPEGTTLILQGKKLSFLYGAKINALINVSKVCRAAVEKELKSGKDCTEIAKLGRATYAHLKKAL